MRPRRPSECEDVGTPDSVVTFVCYLSVLMHYHPVASSVEGGDQAKHPDWSFLMLLMHRHQTLDAEGHLQAHPNMP